MKQHFEFDRMGLVVVVDEVSSPSQVKVLIQSKYEERKNIKVQKEDMVAKDKVEIICHFTGVTRASCSHDNMQSLFILLEDSITALT